MNYNALYKYLRDISQSLDLSVKFFHGRKEILNLTSPNQPLYIYSLPFTSTGSLTGSTQQVNETWQANLIFYMQDQGDSAIDQNNENSIQSEIEILTIAENAASKFIHYVNANQLNDDLSDAADQLTVVSFTKSPAIKDTAQLLTGFLVTINILVPDSFDYCC
jgi:hypothetical protein